MTPRSFICSHCKREHVYSAWVYAHWDMTLTHNCECGAVHRLQNGRATLDHMNGKHKEVKT
jgi:hypothetical protein